MRIRKADLATEKEIMSFFTRLMRDEQAETPLRIRAAEMIYKQLRTERDEHTTDTNNNMRIQVEYQNGGDNIERIAEGSTTQKG